MHKSMCTGSPGSVTLGDYLRKYYPEEMKKKLTFEEWWESKLIEDNMPFDVQHSLDVIKEAWKVAQENV